MTTQSGPIIGDGSGTALPPFDPTQEREAEAEWECCGEMDFDGFCPDSCPHVPREPYRPELFTGPVRRVRRV